MGAQSSLEDVENYVFLSTNHTLHLYELHPRNSKQLFRVTEETNWRTKQQSFKRTYADSMDRVERKRDKKIDRNWILGSRALG